MPRVVVNVTPEEVDGLVTLIENRAKEMKLRRVTFTHDEIEESKLLLEEDRNRIRHKFATDLKTRGIRLFYSPDGYSFSLPASFELGIINPQKAPTITIDDTKRQKMETATHFDTKYVAPPLYRDVKLAIEAGRKPLIFGPAGCGKSRMFEELAARAGVRAFRRALSQVSDPAELIGTIQIVKDDGVATTRFVDGMITRCARNGYFCILDELDNASAAANEALKQITEDGGVLVVETENGTEVIECDALFRMCFTANTRGFGDATGLFVNAQQQNNALMSRLRPKFDMEYQPEVEEKVIRSLGLPDMIVDALYHRDEKHPDKDGLVHLIRQTIKRDAIQGALSFRAMIGLAKDFTMYGWNKAFLYNVCHDFDEQFAETICNIVASKLGQWSRPTNEKGFLTKHKDEIVKNGFAG